MTDGIKRMLAERAALEKAAEDKQADAARWLAIVDDFFKMVAKAAPFMDEGSPPGEWPPSTRFVTLYCCVATSPGGGHPREALEFLMRMLDRARALWIAGYHPDPWKDNPPPRAGMNPLTPAPPFEIHGFPAK